MNNCQDKTSFVKSIYTCLGFFTLLACSASLQAEIVGGTHWLVRPGESTYSIARKLYPNDLKQREQFRIELIQANADVFRDGAQNMKVGSKLKLPAMAQAKQTIKTTAPQVKPVMQNVANKATPDPKDTIGRIIINIGTVQAENRGSVRPLKRNSEIIKGDTLKTADNSHAQIRLKDGALISLRPNTEFQIEEYSFNGKEDGSEKSIFNLIKGGFRTITGLIGHRNKQNYSVHTSVATIGIRGTHYGLMLCTAGSCANESSDGMADGLYGGVVDGSIITENETGINQFNNDQYFHIASPRTPPVEILLPPPVFHDRGLAQQFTGKHVSDQHDGTVKQSERGKGFHNPMTLIAFNNEGRPQRPLPLLPDQTTNTFELPLPPIAPDGSGMALAFSHFDGTNDTGVGAPIIITPNGANRIFLEPYTLAGGTVVKLPFGVHEESFNQNGEFQRHDAARLHPDGTGASIADADGTLNYGGVIWGRWNGDFVVLENGSPLLHNQDFHFIYSPNLTTPTELTNLGGLRSRIEIFRATAGTMPTDIDGLIGADLPDISAILDFVNHQLLDYSVSVNNFSLLDHSAWSASSINPISFSDLNHSFQIEGNIGSCLTSSTQCTGEASFMFVGDAAGAAISSYSIFELDGTYGVSGVALLSPYTQVTANSGSVMHFAFNDFNSSDTHSGEVVISPTARDNIYLANYTDPQTSLQIPTPAAAIGQVYLPSQSALIPTAIMINPGSTPVEFGYTDQVSYQGSPTPVSVNWGRWYASDTTVIENNTSIDHNDVHFIYSNNLTSPATLASLIGTSRTTTYNTLVGSSTPTDNFGFEALGPASFQITAYFNTGTLDYSVATSVNSLSYAGSATGIDFASLNNGFNIADNSINCDFMNCSGRATLSFVGNNAEAVITSFTIDRTTPTPSTTTVSGTALVSDNF